MSMNKNKIEYYYENNDILQAKIKRLINENLDREEDVLSKIAELSKIGIQIEIQKLQFIQKKQLDIRKYLKVIMLNLKNIHFLKDIKQMIS